ncbi:MAG: hypothetical protein SVV67_02070 [Bacillota bacterium]|nr:hypothetical protein [Bacillota bacterium]
MFEPSTDCPVKEWRSRALVDHFFPSVLPKVDHFFPGVGGSIFFWRVDHIFLDDRIQTGKTQKSLTDPDSKLMLTGGKMDVCFNVQTAVESKSHIVADFMVIDHPNDIGMLSEVAKGAKVALNSDGIAIVADKGYRQNEDILNCLLEGDTSNVYTHEKQECYTFKFTKKDDEITEEMRISTEKETMLKCISAGVLLEILENKNLVVEEVEAYKEKTLIVDEITGEIITNRAADESIKTEEVSNPPKQHYFKRDLQTDTVICPMGKILHRKGFIASKGTRYYNRLACSQCANKCTTSKYRSVDFIGKKTIIKTTFYTKDSWRFGRHPALKKGEKRIRVDTFVGNEVLLKFYPDEELLKLRGRIVEHPFGTIKRWCDGSYLLLKGKKKATADLALSFLGYNLKRAITKVGVKGLLTGI